MPSYREVLQQKFSEEYDKLNLQQRKAVDTIEGPVMVIAGPGTGKTQILAARIGKILLETDALPENILCLTYTDAGTIAMRKRLVQFIGADAYKVNIYTFHAFCNDVIQENLSLFEKTSLDPVSELERIELFKKLIDAFPKNHLLKRYRGDVYFEINNLQQLFSSMKREGWLPQFINSKIDEYINDLPLRDEYIAKRATKEFKKGDVRTDKIEEEKERMEKLRSAVNEFENYQKLLRQHSRYDFDDMINWVIKAFEENKNLLANYQEKFQYILVDEYQDTSGTQNKLVQLLISYWEKPNVFVVGDDDQSIYRFQGANVENMLEFANNYSKDLLTVVLSSNYRSTQPILDISKTLINKNEERLVKQIEGLSKELLSSNKKINHLTNQPQIREYKSVKEEMAGITNEIETLIQQGVSAGKIAVIYKENKYGLELTRYLQLKNIAVYSKRSINILEDPFINKILQLLRYLNAEHDIPYGGDEMLFEILHYDFYKIPPIEIAKLTVEVNSKKYNGELTSIRKLLNEKANTPAKTLFDVGLNENLKNISIVLEGLIADVPNVTLQQLFENVVTKANILSYIMQSDKKIALLQLLTALFDFIKEETSRNPTLNLEGLINIIDLMEKEGLPLPMIRISGSDKGVNLLTAHGSKGLEFEYVFFAGCNSSSWEKKRKPGGGYKFPDTIFSLQPTKNLEEEELRRLFYVALTRAEKHLFISYSKFRNDGREIEPSMFIAEILEEHALPIETINLTTEELATFELLNFTAQAPEIDKAEEDFIDSLLEKFVMNVTALNNYLKCPLEFYYKNLIRIPSGKSEATEFGSAVHHALEKLFRKMQEGKKDTFPPKEELIMDFQWYMHRHRENFTKEAFDRRMEYGDEVLSNYYDKYVNTWNKIVTVERNIRNVTNGVPIKGKLDKLEFNGKEVNVVDYKTGDIDKAKPKLQAPNDKEPNGGDYWRQAVFYKILVDNYEQKDWKVVSTEFDFIEPDKKKEYQKAKIVINPNDITTVTQQIAEVWQKIQERDFYTGCGKEDCHWCNFVKENQLAVKLHELTEEEAGEF
ncbi:ATP-dependent DNA helicase [Ferruginibacter albus]|uniref:ATP-dependent DNA helicase n=1 Tax=Ferruginibacter albus TaxID=2875540 RepID=UPI001CC4A2BE|nr:ATP-dependent DNA helicase [Ferruginibacter albus]UAY52206.1 ATP-dependent helicase [Ferruginibacter albus]